MSTSDKITTYVAKERPTFNSLLFIILAVLTFLKSPLLVTYAGIAMVLSLFICICVLINAVRLKQQDPSVNLFRKSFFSILCFFVYSLIWYILITLPNN